MVIWVKSLAPIGNPNVTTTLVEHCDRFCRFGAEYIEVSLGTRSIRLVVVDFTEIDDDLMKRCNRVVDLLCVCTLWLPSVSIAQKAIDALCPRL